MMRRRLGGCCFGGSETETLLSPTLSDTWNREQDNIFPILSDFGLQ